MNTILIPVDFSSGSLMTVKIALSIAGNDKTRVHLFHIYPDQLMIPDSSFIDGMDTNAFLSRELTIELRKQAEKQITNFEKEVQQLIKDSGKQNITLTHSVTGGDPEWEIKDVCEQLLPGLIIMGTSGEGRKGFLEGNMAGKIMNSVQIPVIAIPESMTSSIFSNIMYATNFSGNDLEHLKRIIRVFTSFDIQIHVVHFELKGRPSEYIQEMQSLQDDVKQQLPDKDIRFHLMDSDDKSSSLQHFVKSNDIDLIAFAAHKTNIFQNLFSNKIHKKDFFRLELPMLALHD